VCCHRKVKSVNVFKEVIDVYSQSQINHKSTLFVQSAEFINVTEGGTYSYHWALNGVLQKAYYVLIRPTS
jgi:hypothetical protein